MAQLRDLLVNGASRFLGIVNFNNEAIFNDSVTLNETLNLLKTTNAEGGSYTSPALVIGPSTLQHLEFDTNEIMSKSAAGTTATLYLNNHGGQVVIGKDGLKVGDGTAATAKNTGDLQVAGGLSTTAASFFGGGVTIDSTLSVTGNATIGDATSDVHKVNGNLTHNGIVYFANGTTYYVNASGNAKFNTLTSVGNTTLGDSATGDTIAINGVTTITGATKVVGTFTAQGDVIPSANDTYSLGSSAYKWKELYVDSTAYIGDGANATSTSSGSVRVTGGIAVTKDGYFGGNITAVNYTGKKLSLNDTATSGNGIYLYRNNGTTNEALRINVDANNGTITNTNETLQSILNLVLEYNDTSNNGAGAGSKTIEFKATSAGSQISAGHFIASGNLQVNGNATIGDATSDVHTIKGNTTLSGNFIPGTTIAYDLGSTQKYWKNLYVGNGTAGAVSNTGTQTGSIVVSGGMSLSNDIAIKCEDNDRAIKFVYGKSSNNGYGWQIKYAGTGSDDANYLQIDSAGSDGTYKTAVRYGLLTLDAGFGGHIYPITAFGKNIGSTSNPWSTVYAKSYKIYNASKKDSGGIYVQTDGTASEQGESYIVAGNATASGTAGNSRGSIFLYSTSTGYTRLIPGTNNGTNYNLYLPGASGQLVYHTNDTVIGSSMAPVYVDSGGKITECNMAASGDWWGALPVIGSDGVMEVGKYFDFHITDTATSDYDYRLEASATNLKGSGALEASTSIKAGTSITSGTTMTVGTNLTVKGTTTLGDAEGDTVSIVGDTTFSNDVVISKTLKVNGDTTLGDATTDNTTIQGTVSLTGNGTLATGSTATALSGMTGNLKVFNGGIVTNKDVAADNFYVKDKVRIKYDTTNDYMYFVFN